MAHTQVLLMLPPVPDFIGRQEQLRALDGAVNAGGNTHLVLITGEPGVGRTRLFYRWLESAPKWQALAATSPRPTPIPGGMAAELLRAWAEQLGAQEDAPRFLAALDQLARGYGQLPCGGGLAAGRVFLARLMGFEPNDEHERSLRGLGYFGELISAMRSLLECLSRQAREQSRGLVIFADDLDTADRSSKDLLDAAVQGVPAEVRPVVVATCHLDDGTGAGLASMAMGRAGVHVGSFSAQEQSAFVTKMLRGATLPDRFNETLWRRTEGNPLATEQQLRLLVTTGILQAGANGRWTVAEGVGSAGSTKTLPALIADVLRGLPGPTLQAVVAASATGLRARRQHVQAVVRELGGDVADLDRHCVRLVRQGVLKPLATPEGEWVFRHPLMYEACSLVMPAADQRQFHAAALTALGPFASVSGLRLCATAFSHALRSRQYEQALGWAEQATRDAERMGLTQGVIEVAERAMPLFVQVADKPHSIQHKANIVMAAGYVWARWGDVNRAVQAHALIPTDKSLPPELYARVLEFRAELHSVSGRYPDVFAAIETLLRDTDPQSLTFAELSYALGNVVRRRGDWARARECYAAARVVFEHHNKIKMAVDCLHQAASAYRADNQLREAEILLDEALQLVDRIGDRSDLCRTLITLGILHAHRSDLRAAEDAFRGAHDLGVAIGDYLRVDQAKGNLAACRRLRGFYDEARQIFREVLERSRKLNQWPRMANSLINLADIDLSEDKFDSAITMLKEARSRIEHSNNMFMYPSCLLKLLEAHVGAKRYYEARALVDETKREVQARGQGENAALVFAYEGEICSAMGELEPALRCFDQALRLYDDYVALGKTPDNVLRADVSWRYAWFLLQHEAELKAGNLIADGPRRRAAELLKEAEVELRDWITRGFGSRQKELDRVVDMMGGLQG